MLEEGVLDPVTGAAPGTWTIVAGRGTVTSRRRRAAARAACPGLPSDRHDPLQLRAGRQPEAKARWRWGRQMAV